MAASIILVDDHQIMREGMRLLFESAEEGFRVLADVADGRAAVRVVAQHRPDVVVMDIGMPGLNGIEATEQIRVASPKTRVVAVSAHQDERSVIGMLRAGARGYVPKEHAFDELVRALRTVLAGQVYLSPAIATRVVERALHPEAVAPDAGRSVLSAREREVVQLVAEGLTTKDIATRLCVSVKTVETHRKQIMDKLDIRSIAGLTKWALREGLTSNE